MVSRVKDWLRQAERNLISAEVNYANSLYEESCYESQQVAEKSVKGLLNFLHKEERGHSITLLLRSTYISVPDDIISCAQELDKHYIPSRYPDAYAEGAPADYYNKSDAERCISCAKKILSWVKSIVGFM
ncbi:HEPN domain-containing protein [Sulfolobus sp. E5-1-F]|uniref:HEPN domain-containing protein n=1 Tax=Sulfolobaceae TaxID=118883 RepID=UPI001294E04C|nr:MULTISPECIES: HEPN domain-containing protein [unclassified Sulfolobus]QGA53756.1 HEPN domain-containing protein [Sulfolobus sp. E5-1-F]QGA68593.1 HEPN domain-containing protein [Sulfolobus sp. E11-6]